MHSSLLFIWQKVFHNDFGKIFSVIEQKLLASTSFHIFSLRLLSAVYDKCFTRGTDENLQIQFWFKTVESTDPLTTEENNFLDHIEQKIHQTAAENEERARQRQVSL